MSPHITIRWLWDDSIKKTSKLRISTYASIPIPKCIQCNKSTPEEMSFIAFNDHGIYCTTCLQKSVDNASLTEKQE